MVSGEFDNMAVDFGPSRRGEIEEHLTIEVIPEGDLVLSIKEKMENISISGTICRVPEELLRRNKEEYVPRLVSIGPLHHGKVSQATEDIKWQYLNTILTRKPGLLDQTLDACVKTLKNLENKARRCYKENLDHIASNEFAEMLLLDGCFIIELFLKFAVKNLRRRDDPCFTKKEQFLILRCDLILLENQIPFFVLQQLFHLVPIPKQCSQSLIELALFFFRKLVPGEDLTPRGKFGPDVHHLLDLIRQCHLPTIPEIQSCWTETNIPSAAKLKAQGIKFNDATSDQPLLNIQFDEGILEISPLKIHKHTEILLRNLVALESCSSSSPKHITSYVFLMKQLIKNKNDVRILDNRDILIDGLEKQEEIVHLFRSFHHLDMKVEDFYYRWICEKIDEYGRMKQQKHWGRRIRHLYGRTSFGVAGLTVAVIVIVAIFTAALFAVLAIFLHHVS